MNFFTKLATKMLAVLSIVAMIASPAAAQSLSASEMAFAFGGGEFAGRGTDHVSSLLEAMPMQQQDVEISRVHRALQNIARAPTIKGYVTICSGTTHASVAKDIGAEVLYSASGVNGAWNYVPLPKPKFFIARLDQTRIPEFFKSIDDYACVAFMIVPADEEQNIVENIILDRNPFRSIALNLPDHLLYFVDTDNPESSTGISEAISVGCNSPLKGRLIFA